MLPNPIYQNLFEVFLISSTFIITDEIFDHKLEFINDETNQINLNFTINEKIMNNWNTQNMFKDIHYLHFSIHDKLGNILKKELLLVKFKSLQFTFQYSAPELLKINLRLYNLGTEECIGNPFMIQKELIRDSKIKNILN